MRLCFHQFPQPPYRRALTPSSPFSLVLQRAIVSCELSHRDHGLLGSSLSPLAEFAWRCVQSFAYNMRIAGTDELPCESP